MKNNFFMIPPCMAISSIIIQETTLLYISIPSNMFITHPQGSHIWHHACWWCLYYPKKTSNTQLLWMIHSWTCVPPSSRAAREYNWDMHAFKAPTKITGMAQHPSSSSDSFIYHEQCFLQRMGSSNTWYDLNNLIMGTCLITGTLITNGLYLLELHPSDLNSAAERW
jgi:hypothetical protein